MPKSFSFINVDTGTELEVLKALREIEGVEAYFVSGAYDLVAKVTSESMEDLKDKVTWKIRRLNKVRSTLTMIVKENPK